MPKVNNNLVRSWIKDTPELILEDEKVSCKACDKTCLMQHAGAQYGPGAAPSLHSTSYTPPENTPSVPSGNTTTSVLRSWRKKDATEKLPPADPPPTFQIENQGPVARVAPHAHYPKPPSDVFRYSQHYGDCSSLPQPPQTPVPVKYSEIIEPMQGLDHLTPLVSKPNGKTYTDMCNIQQTHMKPYPDHGNYKPYQNNVKSYTNMHYKEQFHPYLPKESQMPNYAQSETNFAPYLANYKMQEQYSRTYRENNDFIASLNKIDPNMTKSMFGVQHCPQLPSYQSLEPNRLYQQQPRIYPTASSYPESNLPQNYNPYGLNPQRMPPNPYRLHQYQNNITRFPQMSSPVEQMPNSISPRHQYHENMSMNFPPLNPRISPSYNPCGQLEYSNHYQHRQDQYMPVPSKSAYLDSRPEIPEIASQGSLQQRAKTLKGYLETWSEEQSSITIEESDPTDPVPQDKVPVIKTPVPNRESTLYVLDAMEVSSENISQYLHLQPLDKLPSNIRGFYANSGGILPEIVAPDNAIIIPSSVVNQTVSPGISVRQNPEGIVTQNVENNEGQAPERSENQNGKTHFDHQNSQATAVIHSISSSSTKVYAQNSSLSHDRLKPNRYLKTRNEEVAPVSAANEENYAPCTSSSVQSDHIQVLVRRSSVQSEETLQQANMVDTCDGGGTLTKSDNSEVIKRPLADVSHQATTLRCSSSTTPSNPVQVLTQQNEETLDSTFFGEEYNVCRHSASTLSSCRDSEDTEITSKTLHDLAFQDSSANFCSDSADDDSVQILTEKNQIQNEETLRCAKNGEETRSIEGSPSYSKNPTTARCASRNSSLQEKPLITEDREHECEIGELKNNVSLHSGSYTREIPRQSPDAIKDRDYHEIPVRKDGVLIDLSETEKAEQRHLVQTSANSEKQASLETEVRNALHIFKDEGEQYDKLSVKSEEDGDDYVACDNECKCKDECKNNEPIICKNFAIDGSTDEMKNTDVDCRRNLHCKCKHVHYSEGVENEMKNLEDFRNVGCSKQGCICEGKCSNVPITSKSITENVVTELKEETTQIKEESVDSPVEKIDLPHRNIIEDINPEENDNEENGNGKQNYLEGGQSSRNDLDNLKQSPSTKSTEESTITENCCTEKEKTDICEKEKGVTDLSNFENVSSNIRNEIEESRSNVMKTQPCGVESDAQNGAVKTRGFSVSSHDDIFEGNIMSYQNEDDEENVSTLADALEEMLRNQDTPRILRGKSEERTADVIKKTYCSVVDIPDNNNENQFKNIFRDNECSKKIQPGTDIHVVSNARKGACHEATFMLRLNEDTLSNEGNVITERRSYGCNACDTQPIEAKIDASKDNGNSHTEDLVLSNADKEDSMLIDDDEDPLRDNSKLTVNVENSVDTKGVDASVKSLVISDNEELKMEDVRPHSSEPELLKRILSNYETADRCCLNRIRTTKHGNDKMECTNTDSEENKTVEFATASSENRIVQCNKNYVKNNAEVKESLSFDKNCPILSSNYDILSITSAGYIDQKEECLAGSSSNTSEMHCCDDINMINKIETNNSLSALNATVEDCAKELTDRTTISSVSSDHSREPSQEDNLIGSDEGGQTLRIENTRTIFETVSPNMKFQINETHFTDVESGERFFNSVPDLDCGSNTPFKKTTNNPPSAFKNSYLNDCNSSNVLLGENSYSERRNYKRKNVFDEVSGKKISAEEEMAPNDLMFTQELDFQCLETGKKKFKSSQPKHLNEESEGSGEEDKLCPKNEVNAAASEDGYAGLPCDDAEFQEAANSNREKVVSNAPVSNLDSNIEEGSADDMVDTQISESECSVEDKSQKNSTSDVSAEIVCKCGNNCRKLFESESLSELAFKESDETASRDSLCQLEKNQNCNDESLENCFVLKIANELLQFSVSEENGEKVISITPLTSVKIVVNRENILNHSLLKKRNKVHNIEAAEGFLNVEKNFEGEEDILPVACKTSVDLSIRNSKDGQNGDLSNKLRAAVVLNEANVEEYQGTQSDDAEDFKDCTREFFVQEDSNLNLQNDNGEDQQFNNPLNKKISRNVIRNIKKSTYTCVQNLETCKSESVNRRRISNDGSCEEENIEYIELSSVEDVGEYNEKNTHVGEDSLYERDEENVETEEDVDEDQCSQLSAVPNIDVSTPEIVLYNDSDLNSSFDCEVSYSLTEEIKDVTNDEEPSSCQSLHGDSESHMNNRLSNNDSEIVECSNNSQDNFKDPHDSKANEYTEENVLKSHTLCLRDDDIGLSGKNCANIETSDIQGDLDVAEGLSKKGFKVNRTRFDAVEGVFTEKIISHAVLQVKNSLSENIQDHQTRNLEITKVVSKIPISSSEKETDTSTDQKIVLEHRSQCTLSDGKSKMEEERREFCDALDIESGDSEFTRKADSVEVVPGVQMKDCSKLEYEARDTLREENVEVKEENQIFDGLLKSEAENPRCTQTVTEVVHDLHIAEQQIQTLNKAKTEICDFEEECECGDASDIEMANAECMPKLEADDNVQNLQSLLRETKKAVETREKGQECSCKLHADSEEFAQKADSVEVAPDVQMLDCSKLETLKCEARDTSREENVEVKEENQKFHGSLKSEAENPRCTQTVTEVVHDLHIAEHQIQTLNKAKTEICDCEEECECSDASDIDMANAECMPGLEASNGIQNLQNLSREKKRVETQGKNHECSCKLHADTEECNVCTKTVDDAEVVLDLQITQQQIQTSLNEEKTERHENEDCECSDASEMEMTNAEYMRKFEAGDNQSLQNPLREERKEIETQEKNRECYSKSHADPEEYNVCMQTVEDAEMVHDSQIAEQAFQASLKEEIFERHEYDNCAEECDECSDATKKQMVNVEYMPRLEASNNIQNLQNLSREKGEVETQGKNQEGSCKSHAYPEEYNVCTQTVEDAEVVHDLQIAEQQIQTSLNEEKTEKHESCDFEKDCECSDASNIEMTNAEYMRKFEADDNVQSLKNPSIEKKKEVEMQEKNLGCVCKLHSVTEEVHNLQIAEQETQTSLNQEKTERRENCDCEEECDCSNTPKLVSNVECMPKLETGDNVNNLQNLLSEEKKEGKHQKCSCKLHPDTEEHHVCMQIVEDEDEVVLDLQIAEQQIKTSLNDQTLERHQSYYCECSDDTSKIEMVNAKVMPNFEARANVQNLKNSLKGKNEVIETEGKNEECYGNLHAKTEQNDMQPVEDVEVVYDLQISEQKIQTSLNEEQTERRENYDYEEECECSDSSKIEIANSECMPKLETGDNVQALQNLSREEKKEVEIQGNNQGCYCKLHANTVENDICIYDYKEECECSDASKREIANAECMPKLETGHNVQYPKSLSRGENKEVEKGKSQECYCKLHADREECNACMQAVEDAEVVHDLHIAEQKFPASLKEETFDRHENYDCAEECDCCDAPKIEMVNVEYMPKHEADNDVQNPQNLSREKGKQVETQGRSQECSCKLLHAEEDAEMVHDFQLAGQQIQTVLNHDKTERHVNYDYEEECVCSDASKIEITDSEYRRKLEAADYVQNLQHLSREKKEEIEVQECYCKLHANTEENSVCVQTVEDAEVVHDLQIAAQKILTLNEEKTDRHETDFEEQCMCSDASKIEIANTECMSKLEVGDSLQNRQNLTSGKEKDVETQGTIQDCYSKKKEVETQENNQECVCKLNAGREAYNVCMRAVEGAKVVDDLQIAEQEVQASLSEEKSESREDYDCAEDCECSEEVSKIEMVDAEHMLKFEAGDNIQNWQNPLKDKTKKVETQEKNRGCYCKLHADTEKCNACMQAVENAEVLHHLHIAEQKAKSALNVEKSERHEGCDYEEYFKCRDSLKQGMSNAKYIEFETGDLQNLQKPLSKKGEIQDEDQKCYYKLHTDQEEYNVCTQATKNAEVAHDLQNVELVIHKSTSEEEADTENQENHGTLEAEGSKNKVEDSSNEDEVEIQRHEELERTLKSSGGEVTECVHVFEVPDHLTQDDTDIQQQNKKFGEEETDYKDLDVVEEGADFMQCFEVNRDVEFINEAKTEILEENEEFEIETVDVECVDNFEVAEVVRDVNVVQHVSITEVVEDENVMVDLTTTREVEDCCNVIEHISKADIEIEKLDNRNSCNLTDTVTLETSEVVLSDFIAASEELLNNNYLDYEVPYTLVNADVVINEEGISETQTDVVVSSSSDIGKNFKNNNKIDLKLKGNKPKLPAFEDSQLRLKETAAKVCGAVSEKSSFNPGKKVINKNEVGDKVKFNKIMSPLRRYRKRQDNEGTDFEGRSTLDDKPEISQKKPLNCTIIPENVSILKRQNSALKTNHTENQRKSQKPRVSFKLDADGNPISQVIPSTLQIKQCEVRDISGTKRSTPPSEPKNNKLCSAGSLGKSKKERENGESVRDKFRKMKTEEEKLSKEKKLSKMFSGNRRDKVKSRAILQKHIADEIDRNPSNVKDVVSSSSIQKIKELNVNTLKKAQGSIGSKSISIKDMRDSIGCPKTDSELNNVSVKNVIFESATNMRQEPIKQDNLPFKSIINDTSNKKVSMNIKTTPQKEVLLPEGRPKKDVQSQARVKENIKNAAQKDLRIPKSASSEFSSDESVHSEVNKGNNKRRLSLEEYISRKRRCLSNEAQDRKREESRHLISEKSADGVKNDCREKSCKMRSENEVIDATSRKEEAVPKLEYEKTESKKPVLMKADTTPPNSYEGTYKRDDSVQNKEDSIQSSVGREKREEESANGKDCRELEPKSIYKEDIGSNKLKHCDLEPYKRKQRNFYLDTSAVEEKVNSLEPYLPKVKKIPLHKSTQEEISRQLDELLVQKPINFESKSRETALIQRFLKVECLKPDEVQKVKEIIQYKRALEEFKLRKPDVKRRYSCDFSKTVNIDFKDFDVRNDVPWNVHKDKANSSEFKEETLGHNSQVTSVTMSSVISISNAPDSKGAQSSHFSNLNSSVSKSKEGMRFICEESKTYQNMVPQIVKIETHIKAKPSDEDDRCNNMFIDCEQSAQHNVNSNNIDTCSIKTENMNLDINITPKFSKKTQRCKSESDIVASNSNLAKSDLYISVPKENKIQLSNPGSLREIPDKKTQFCDNSKVTVDGNSNLSKENKVHLSNPETPSGSKAPASAKVNNDLKPPVQLPQPEISRKHKIPGYTVEQQSPCSVRLPKPETTCVSKSADSLKVTNSFHIQIPIKTYRREGTIECKPINSNTSKTEPSVKALKSNDQRNLVNEFKTNSVISNHMQNSPQPKVSSVNKALKSSDRATLTQQDTRSNVNPKTSTASPNSLKMSLSVLLSLYRKQVQAINEYLTPVDIDNLNKVEEIIQKITPNLNKDGAAGPSKNLYEIKQPELQTVSIANENLKIHLKKVQSDGRKRRKRFRNLYTGDDSDEESQLKPKAKEPKLGEHESAEFSASNSSVIDYSVYQRKSRAGVPKLIIKRRKSQYTGNSQPFVKLIRIPSIEAMVKRRKRTVKLSWR